MILVFGSLNIDLVFAGDSLPRAGVTLLTPSYDVLPGGKGANQAVAAARADAETVMSGAVGDDAFGRLACATLVESGVDARYVARVGAPTGCAAISVDAKGENAIVAGSGANLLARAAQVPDSLLGPATTLVLQCEVPVEESAALAVRAKAAHARVILNLAPAGPLPPTLLECVDILVLNEHEAATLTGSHDLAGESSIFAAHDGLTIIVTRGRDGCEAIFPNGDRLRIPALPIKPVDTTGAGDAFVGVLAASLDRGHSIEEALRRASVGAGLACLVLGAQTSMPRSREIEAHLSELPPATAISRTGKSD
ncbi:MAG TPA: ribokinase [Alphaproteobacteria bacterium]